MDMNMDVDCGQWERNFSLERRLQIGLIKVVMVLKLGGDRGWDWIYG